MDATPSPFDADTRYSTAEACELAEVSRVDLRNWRLRSVIRVGTHHPAFGRSAYSSLDVLALHVIGALGRNVGMAPRDAAVIAGLIVQHVTGDVLPGSTILLQRDAAGAWRGCFPAIPAPSPGAPQDAPHIIVPFAALAATVARRIAIAAARYPCVSAKPDASPSSLDEPGRSGLVKRKGWEARTLFNRGTKLT